MARINLRRAAASVLLVSAISWIPSSAAAAVRPAAKGKENAAALRFEARTWLANLMVGMMEKAGVRIDPDGNRTADGPPMNKAGVRIDPDGHQ
jgi:hypothetical protein